MKTGRQGRRCRTSRDRGAGRSRDAAVAGAATAAYYQAHFQAYHEETFPIEPSSFLGPFVRRLAPGSLVLDIGCGSGRDLVWLQRQGLRVVGFERAPGLADLARHQAGCEVIDGDFAVYDFTSLHVDALLLSGSLVHVAHGELAAVLQNILPALNDREVKGPAADDLQTGPRWVYVSLKEGHGRYEDDRGRTFYRWSDQALRGIFRSLDLSVGNFRRSPSVDGRGTVWLGYVLQHRRDALQGGAHRG